ncbi:hypothetical protein HRbin36_00634 [bacterium HR36]|nr:hypothetical protein HRbin36_00634 [bacterium HR36]
MNCTTPLLLVLSVALASHFGILATVSPAPGQVRRTLPEDIHKLSPAFLAETQARAEKITHLPLRAACMLACEELRAEAFGGLRVMYFSTKGRPYVSNVIGETVGVPRGGEAVPAKELHLGRGSVILRRDLDVDVLELSIYDPETHNTSIGTRVVGKIMYRLNVTVYEYRGLRVMSRVAIWRLQAGGRPLNWDKLMRELPKVCEKTFIGHQAFTIENGRLTLDTLYLES